MIFSDKYKLTREQSVFLAKKKMDENIYCGMKMENRAVTFPQTKTILSGVNVAGVQLDDIQAILNMRDAWRFLLSSIDEPVNVEYMCKLNEFIARNEALKWGVLRGGSVGISGCDYVPPIPEYETVKRELEAILSQDKTATGSISSECGSDMRKFRKCASLSSAGAKPILTKYGSNCCFAHATASGEKNSPLAP